MRTGGGGSPVRRLPVGAEVVPEGVHFRVWAPARREVDVLLEDGSSVPLAPEPGGYFSGLLAGVGDGARYRFRVDGGEAYPDPASRFQPEGPHGPSQVVDPTRFRWTDAAAPGLSARGQVLYELHVGTFTPEGTWDAAARELAALARLGITAVEVMPVAEFPGRFGWGYDGVDLFAPSHLYGPPDAFRRFVDHAHAVGLGVLLDVVYNHCGPDGCYLRAFAPAYFSTRYRGDWGDPLNYDGEDAAPVRELVVENAAYWISEFHLDGLRVDATQGMFDASPHHVLEELVRRCREAGGDRDILLVAENEPQDVRLLRPPERGGYGFDMAWNDDFHHSAVVALTGRREAYYSDHRGTPQELVSAAKRGYLFQGQRYAWQGKRRGTSTAGLPPSAFVAYVGNHDQLANSSHGERVRLRTSPGRWRAMTALLLLGPWTPMLFQGDEHGSTRPFLYFADHRGELGERVRAGRAAFVRQFPSVAGSDMRDRLADPCADETFLRSKLDPAERAAGGPLLALHRDLLELRRSDPVIAAVGAIGADGIDGAVLGPEAFCLRYAGPGGRDRLLLVNLGPDLDPPSLAEPLVAPPDARGWAVLWSSEDPRYGGSGTPELAEGGGQVLLPGHSALLLAPPAGALLG
jgi:maltooligosyltrehalose trehalohydrolase